MEKVNTNSKNAGKSLYVPKSSEGICNALKQHELALARLYKIYSKIFQENINFWLELSKDELKHAGWLNFLYDKIINKQEDFVINRFHIEAIENSLDYIKELQASANQPDFTLINALSIAMQLENALLENKYFEVFEGDGVITRKILSRLAESTREHYDKLHNLWQKKRGKAKHISPSTLKT